MELPRATPMARSILFLTATNTAVMCSQAFPAMGSTMRPRKAWLSPDFWLTSSRAPVRNLGPRHRHSHTTPALQSCLASTQHVALQLGA